MDLRISGDVTIPASDLEWTFLPTGGPGGQHANRSATKVVVRFDAAASRAFDEPTRRRLLDRLQDPIVSVTVDESRSQWRNRQVARHRLRQRLLAALVGDQEARRPTEPGPGAKQRRLDDKREIAEKKARRRPPEVED